MPQSIEDLTSEHQQSVRAYYVAGKTSLTEALHLLRFGGYYEITREQAVEVLRSFADEIEKAIR